MFKEQTRADQHYHHQVMNNNPKNKIADFLFVFNVIFAAVTVTI